MDGQENKSDVKTNDTRTQTRKLHKLVILHHNVQSLYNKLLDISISVSTDDINADVLCFTEHWLKMNQIDTVYIDQFKLVSSFSRSTRSGGGSSIFIKDFLRTKEVVYINRLGCESTFEVSAIELTDFNLIIICIYRSPDGNFAEFLSILESVICKVQSKGINLFLCGDWNVNFLQKSPNLVDLKNLLLMYNLENMVDSPTRITHSSATQIDVMITNINCVKPTINYDLGYSDHFAQVTNVIVNKPVINPKIIKKRRFSDIETKEFLHHLQTELWEQVLIQDDVNESFNIFMTTFVYYFNIAFPLKNCYLHNKTKNKWITKGLKISKNKLRILNELKRFNQISNESRLYISKYQLMYKHLVKEAKKMYNEAFIQSSKNKTKGIWQVINKETGNLPHNNYNIQLQYNNEAISDPQLISERFNKCFIDTVDDLLNKSGHNLTQTYQQEIKSNSASMFISPITETEIKKVISKLKGKNSAGYDEIPEALIKHCSEYIAKPLTHVFNLSVKLGIFPDAMKIAKITPSIKKETNRIFKTIDP